MAGVARYDNPQSSMPFDVATVKKVRHSTETASPFPGRKHGLVKMYGY